ncbi:uncharacterized protein RAG0_09490 [Rhynchosporium agropyri]|uniref:Uncharacterized protein n=1 Tax=Rhynchosporium agropyri TaxID=914238 RepID=A0A1E1KVQ6_9HELO|nr:uncharacterized protein RAG0_09490 [Rhynchosporium agropyri]
MTFNLIEVAVKLPAITSKKYTLVTMPRTVIIMQAEIQLRKSDINFYLWPTRSDLDYYRLLNEKNLNEGRNFRDIPRPFSISLQVISSKSLISFSKVAYLIKNIEIGSYDQSVLEPLNRPKINKHERKRLGTQLLPSVSFTKRNMAPRKPLHEVTEQVEYSTDLGIETTWVD